MWYIANSCLSSAVLSWSRVAFHYMVNLYVWVHTLKELLPSAMKQPNQENLSSCLVSCLSKILMRFFFLWPEEPDASLFWGDDLKRRKNLEEQRTSLCCKSVIDVDIESADVVAYGVCGKFFEGSWSVWFLYSTYLSSPKLSVAPFLSPGKVFVSGRWWRKKR